MYRMLFVLLSVSLALCAAPISPKQEQIVTSRDGHPIYSVFMPATQNNTKTCKGTVIFTHGITTYAGWCQEFLNYLTEHHFCVLAYDIRGHGKSMGNKKGWITDGDRLVEDLDAIYNAHKSLLQAPIFMAGISFGSLVNLYYLQQPTPTIPVKGLWCGVPALKENVTPAALLLHLLKPLIEERFNDVYIPSDVDLLFLKWTHDQQRMHDWKSSKKKFLLSLPIITLSTAAHMQTIVMNNVANITLPVHVALAEHDNFISNKTAQKFYAELPNPHKSINVFSGMYHSILDEVNRHDVYDACIHILENMINKGTHA